METKTALLFDLDGVIIDSEREYSRIWTRIEEVYPTGKVDFALSIKGMTLDKIVAENFNGEGQREHVEEMLYALEKEMVYDYCPGALPFIDQLVEKSVPRAVVTSSNEHKMAHLFSDIPAFRHKFPIIIDSSCVSKSKPDPEGYLLAAKKLNTDIRNCAVFEDSVQGVMAGRNAGAYVVGITGTKPVEELAPWCDIIIDRLDELDLDELTAILKER